MPTQPRPGVLSWASIADDHTLDQAALSATLPFVRGPVVLMPDAHFGKGATIGSVIATEGAVIPAAVGVDIGCGMAALKTDLKAEYLTDGLLNDLVAQWTRRIPSGVGQGHQKETWRGEGWLEHNPPPFHLTDRQIETTIRQFGTLGSGNHFLELCLDENGQGWVLLHSGSRGIGNQLATEHIKIAQAQMKNWHIELADRDLAYLPAETDEYDAYMEALNWAQGYAAANRNAMLEMAHDQILRIWAYHADFIALEQINCHHNYAALENHGGKNVLLTRKGAIRARVGDMGLIPGSMGTDSYIVRGLGNKAAYDSSPHGAGRAMSRTQARKQFTVDDINRLMVGKAWRADDAKGLLDEIPTAYKDIEQVMEDSKDLVEIVHRLKQVANYKGL
jgi:tRNA-splicing ligase RtcB